MGKTPAGNRPTSARLRLLRFTLLALVSVITYGVLILPLLNSNTVALQPGEVSPSNFQAPQDLRYISEVRTREARDEAADAIAPVYTSPDPTMARRQIERLRAALQYITLVRDDENSTLEQKQTDIASLTDLNLEPETITKIIELPAPRWDVIQQESQSVLEQVMRRSIRDVDLELVRRSVPRW